MNLTSIKNELILFFRFMQRDAFLYRHRVVKYVINYAVIYPILYAFSFGYLQSQIYFQSNNAHLGTILFCGNFLVVAIVLTFKLSVDLLFDIEGERAIDYQIIILRPPLIIIERILFTSLFSFLVLMPFFPVAKILLGSLLVTTHANWIKLALILYASCLMGAAYNHLAACWLPNSNTIGTFWRRCNTPLFLMGGFWIPWYAMNKVSPLLGFITRFNPFLYVTEGIRQSILASSDFLSLSECLSALICFAGIFTFLACFFFKKRMDHI